MRSSVLAVLFPILVACGGGGGNNNDGDPPPVDSPTNPPVPDAPPIPEGYTRLIGRTWNLNAGQLDTYKCVRITIPEDMYITNIQAQAPFGTHHTVLSILQGNDGEADCSVNTLGMQMLYASGVGTAPLDFPMNVGIKVTAGTKLHLNLHLFNATDNPIDGDSAILVKSQPTPPPILAEMVFGGSLNIVVPAGQTRDVVGNCTAQSNYSLFAVWPHMHQAATHQKVEHIRGGNTTVLHDMPYTFAEQNYWLQTPEVQVQAGDRIRTTCTYVNNTGSVITFGDSSNQEMCFTGLYRYPATGSNIFCTN